MSERQPDEPAERDEQDEGDGSGDAAEAERRDDTPDLAELGRRYAVAAGVTRTLRDGFRELKRHPDDAKRLVALLRGLARKHEPEARRAVEQISRVVEKIQRPDGD